MSPDDRDAAVRREIARRGRVPSVRAMARVLGTDPRTIRRAYRRLGVRSHARPGRPAFGATLTHLRIPDALYDSACQIAARRGAAVTEVVRQAAVIGLRVLAHGPNSRS